MKHVKMTFFQKIMIGDLNLVTNTYHPVVTLSDLMNRFIAWGNQLSKQQLCSVNFYGSFLTRRCQRSF